MKIFVLILFLISPATLLAEELPVYSQISSFELLNQEGDTIKAEDLKNKIWIADFIFTRCSGPCPLMTAHMRILQKSFQHIENLQFISFSVDPGYDTPEILKKYGEKHQVDFKNWMFLTGSQEEIRRVATQDFFLGVLDVPEEEREQVDQHVMHSTKFALVDGKGQLRGYYDSQDPGELVNLSKDIQKLLS